MATSRLLSTVLFTLIPASLSAAEIATGPREASPDLVELAVDSILHAAGLPSAGNTAMHWTIFAILFCAAWLFRKFITTAIFAILKKLASKTETTLDDKLFPALEGPVKGLVFVVGSYVALKVLKLHPAVDINLSNLYKIALPVVIFWGIIKAIGAITDHLGEVAAAKGMGISTFMPLIRKTVIIIFVILAILTIFQSFGYDVKTFLAGLGIGGLAFALAAQDTIANLFGSFVIAIDQPFKVGEAIQIGSNVGTVEDIGMRSTKLRTPARVLIAIPNKSVANETITNFTRMPQRRVEQTIGLTYDTTPEQMEAVLEDIRKLLREEPEVHPQTIVVNFSNYGASSLDILIIYFASNPDWGKHMELRERINLKIMKAVAARNLSFAFPTQTVHLDGPVARSLAENKS